MAEVTGPISTLPGAHHKIPDGTMCDLHSDRPATHRVQGETDSFGSELNDMCDECYEELKKNPNPTGTCDWCKTPDVSLRPRRDYDEGTHGPVYHVCQPCIKKDEDRITEEMYDDEEH